MDSKTKVTKETKNKIRVDYEGKLSVKDRMLQKVKASNTWITMVVNAFRFILMLGVSYVILYPFLTKIAGSFMTVGDVIDSTVAIIPKNFNVDLYEYIIFENNYFEAFFNTLLLSLLCALFQTFISCLIGYGLAKFKFKGNKLLMATVVLTMIIPHRMLTMSLMQHFSRFDFLKVLSMPYDGIIEVVTGSSIDLTNTFWPLVILSIFGLAFKNGLYIYMMRQFFKGVPDELEESAYIDGSGVFRTFIQIIIPLSVPMMITIFLFAFSWQWTDEFYTTAFFVNPLDKLWLMPDVYTKIPVDLQVTNNTALDKAYSIVVKNTAGMMIIMPLVIMYIFCQRYIVQGIERSGIVG